jgi:hypothetical protein
MQASKRSGIGLGIVDKMKHPYIKTRFSGGANELYASNGKLRTRGFWNLNCLEPMNSAQTELLVYMWFKFWEIGNGDFFLLI